MMAITLYAIGATWAFVLHRKLAYASVCEAAAFALAWPAFALIRDGERRRRARLTRRKCPMDEKLSDLVESFTAVVAACDYDAPGVYDDKLNRLRFWWTIARGRTILAALRLSQQPPSCAEAVAAAKAEATAAERERCAKIADRFADQNQEAAAMATKRANKLKDFPFDDQRENAEIGTVECAAAQHEAEAIAAAIRKG